MFLECEKRLFWFFSLSGVHMGAKKIISKYTISNEMLEGISVKVRYSITCILHVSDFSFLQHTAFKWSGSSSGPCRALLMSGSLNVLEEGNTENMQYTRSRPGLWQRAVGSWTGPIKDCWLRYSTGVALSPCEKKPDYLEQTQANTERSCKLPAV